MNLAEAKSLGQEDFTGLREKKNNQFSVLKSHSFTYLVSVFHDWAVRLGRLDRLIWQQVP